jgi:hypothetical protein
MSNDIYEKLSALQKVLNVPKTRYNTHLKHYYRNAEDIMAFVKNKMPEGCIIIVTDDMVMIGDRYYVKATAIFKYMQHEVSCNGFARESLEQGKRDLSQITGSASTYARRYALNGLLALDDNKDPDEEDKPEPKEEEKISNNRALHLSEMVTNLNVDRAKILAHYQVNTFNDLTLDAADHLERNLEKKRNEIQVKGAEYARV